jgi:hypothetical protein
MNLAPPVSAELPPSPAPRFCGEVVYLYAFDLAYDTQREPPMRTLLGQPLEPFAIDRTKRTPRQPFSFTPLMARLPAVERIGPDGPVRVQRSLKLLPLGAISIQVRVPFAVASLDDLVDYHDLPFASGSLYDEVRALAGEAFAELKPHLIRPHAVIPDEEAYTVFCLTAPLPAPVGELPPVAEEWFQANRLAVAALLMQELDARRLSRQEATESTALHLSYYDTDLVVVDWDAALIVDEPADLEEPLYVMELANVQLAELESYDRLLDGALERSYRDLRHRPARSRSDVSRELRELRLDLTRFSDDLVNFTKFLGDWHVARIYQKTASRFHLADWHRNIDDKLKTLDDLYQILKHDQTNRWMMILEITIVLLFIIDLVLIFLGLSK